MTSENWEYKIGKLEVKPGDVIVIKSSSRDIKPDEFVRYFETTTPRILSGNYWIFLGPDLDIEVLQCPE